MARPSIRHRREYLLPECFIHDCDRTEGVELYDLKQPTATYRYKQRPLCPGHVVGARSLGYVVS